MSRSVIAIILTVLFLAVPGFAGFARAQYNPMNENKANPKVVPARPDRTPGLTRHAQYNPMNENKANPKVVPARPDWTPGLTRHAQYNPWKEIQAVPPARPVTLPAPFLRG